MKLRGRTDKSRVFPVWRQVTWLIALWALLAPLSGNATLLLLWIPGLVVLTVIWFATRPAVPVHVVDEPAKPDVADQIRKLAELRDAGVLTTAEFDAKKADLLARV
jgi:hypothetical protein